MQSPNKPSKIRRCFFRSLNPNLRNFFLPRRIFCGLVFPGRKFICYHLLVVVVIEMLLFSPYFSFYKQTPSRKRAFTLKNFPSFSETDSRASKQYWLRDENSFWSMALLLMQRSTAFLHPTHTQLIFLFFPLPLGQFTNIFSSKIRFAEQFTCLSLS